MNKERIEKAKRKLAEAQAELDALEAGHWEPTFGELYYYVCGDGSPCLSTCANHPLDLARIRVGNCFRTLEEAKTSRIYKAFHDDYHYWIPGIDREEDKPYKMLAGCEYYSFMREDWVPCYSSSSSRGENVSLIENVANVILRWPKNK